MPAITRDRIGQYMQAALQALADAGGELSSREVRTEVGKRLDLTEYERATYQKSGYVRWESTLHFYSINMKHAGWIRKLAGKWLLTDEGREALRAHTPTQLYERGGEAYRKYERSRAVAGAPEASGEEEEQASYLAGFEQAQSAAREAIAKYIEQLDGYEFQELVAALLRGMGYHTPHIAVGGKDGGVDILAYKDPLGTTLPRLKVQVKHREQKADAHEVREFFSLIHADEVGLFVSSSGFTADAKSEIRMSSKHVEVMDLDRFLDLWDEYYEKLSEDDRALLPLSRVAFFTPKE